LYCGIIRKEGRKDGNRRKYTGGRTSVEDAETVEI
jgi:hypothetical protein